MYLEEVTNVGTAQCVEVWLACLFNSLKLW
jgi:hypothetical protein